MIDSCADDSTLRLRRGRPRIMPEKEAVSQMNSSVLKRCNIAADL